MTELFNDQGVKRLVIEGLGDSSIHNDLLGRSNPDTHPISAITGLTAQIADFESRISANETLLVNHGSRITANEVSISDHETRITALEDENLPFANRLDDTTSATIFFFGEAEPGVVDASALWRISRIEFINPGVDDDIVTTWADGDSDFDNIWDDRLGLSYS